MADSRGIMAGVRLLSTGSCPLVLVLFTKNVEIMETKLVWWPYTADREGAWLNSERGELGVMSRNLSAGCENVYEGLLHNTY